MVVFFVVVRVLCVGIVGWLDGWVGGWVDESFAVSFLVPVCVVIVFLSSLARLVFRVWLFS